MYSGSQSMPLYFDNTNTSYSETNRTFASPQDWTLHSITTLVVHFYGDSENVPGQLYVKINNTRVNYDGPADAVTYRQWIQWNIDLTALATSVVQGVNSLTLGMEGTGSNGTLLIDDILLYEVPPESTIVGPVGPVDPGTDGLLAAYGFDGDVLDTSGNGNNGTVMGTPGYAQGVVGQALDLPGDGASYVDLGANPLFGMQETNQMTVATWVTIRSIPAAWSPVVAKGENAWRLGNYNEENRYHYGITFWQNAGYNADGVTVVGADEWHHVAGTFDGTNVLLYLDGVIDTSNTTEFPIGTNAFNVAVGLNPEATDRTWDGLIDELYIYNRALSPGEVKYLSVP